MGNGGDRRPVRAITCLLIFFVLLIATPLSAQEPGTWAPVADLKQPRSEHTSTLLIDGRALIVGGRDVSGRALATAELFDPATPAAYAQVAGVLPVAVWGHSATRLDDGTVLIVGGKGDGNVPVGAAQLFDPVAGRFAAVAALGTPRAEHTATRLPDGRVLIAGGTDGTVALATVELYDPATRTFVAGGLLTVPRQAHTATLLPDGRVLIAGGANAAGALSVAELYDPKTSTVAMAAALNVARSRASAALLLGGTVLLAGGRGAGDVVLDSAEIYDPSANTFPRAPAPMETARSGHVGLHLLDNGKVLIAGGTSGGRLVAEVEVYDPVLGRFWPVGPPDTARQLFGTSVFALPYAGVLLASGGLDTAHNALASSEVFFYPTLRSDKSDYAPGDIVTLTGEGWLPNETVAINIRESSGDPDTNLTVTADGHGTFTNREFRVTTQDIGVQFLATATGQTSRWTAQATFTDGNVKVFAAPAGVTFTLTFSVFRNSSTCTGTPSDTGTETVGSTEATAFKQGVGNAESILLTASATSDQGGAFIRWTSAFPSTPATPTSSTTICVPGFAGGGTREYFANYVSQADLSITKSDAPDPVTPGGTLTYTLTVTNGGPTGATSVSVTDTLPAGVTFVSASGAGWTCTQSGGTVTCTRASLAAAATATITIVVTVNPTTTGTITNTATVTSVTADPNTANNTATATTTVGGRADLSIAKSGPATASAGTDITYMVTVTNNGPSASSGGTVTDTLPAGTTFAGASSGCSQTAPNVVTCSFGALASGASLTFSIGAHINPATQGQITNTATVTATNASEDNNGANNSATATTTVNRVADLSISKTGPATATAGTDITYTVTVTNNGPSVSSGGTVTDTLPVGTTFAGASSGCSQTAPNVVMCTVATLAPGASATFTIGAHISTATSGAITNTAVVTAAQPLEDNPANNTATATTTVNRVADLSISKTGPATATAGTDITYTVSVTNNGPSTSSGGTVTDTLPAATTFAGASSGCSQTAPNVVTCTFGALAPGAGATFSIGAHINPAAQGTMTNTAEVRSTQPLEDTNPTNNIAAANTMVQRLADLAIAKTGPMTATAGTDITYTVIVTNNGPSASSGGMVTDTLPAGTTFAGASSGCTQTAPNVVMCTVGALAPGASATFGIGAHIAPATQGAIVNTAIIVASVPAEDANALNNTATATTTVERRADLGITKTGPATATAGTDITYTVTVTNNGPSTSSGGTVTDALPAGTTFAGASSGCSQTAPNVATCTFAAVAPGASLTFSIGAHIDPATQGEIINTAVVTAAQPLEDTNPANNAAMVPTTVLRLADLAITKAGPATATSGTTITYTVTVTNNGPSTSTGGTVTDTLPAGTTFAGASSGCTQTAPNVVTCTFGALAPGASVTFSIGAHISVLTLGAITNTAAVTAARPAEDTRADNNVATATTVVSPQTTPGKTTGGGTIDVPGGTANFGFVAQRKIPGGPASGQTQYVDHATGAVLHGTVTALTVVGNVAEFGGSCTINRTTSCTFVVRVQDNGEPGSGRDIFTITIFASPPAVAGGMIRSGNIQVRPQ